MQKWCKIDGPSDYDSTSTDDREFPEIIMMTFRRKKFDDFFVRNRFSNLTYLICVDSGLDDISPLSALVNCPNLSLINCSHNCISSLTGIESLSSVKYFYCNDNQINELSPLSLWNNLVTLECMNNQLYNLNGLEFCSSLKIIKCGENPFFIERSKIIIDGLKKHLPYCVILKGL
jgi:Leucine-rich repeat (LRR) protein